MRFLIPHVAGVLWWLVGTALLAEEPLAFPELKINEFRPKSMLKVPATDLQQAKYPVVDLHTHFDYRLRGSTERLAEFVEVMDRNQIAICVSLDGTLPHQFETHRQFLHRAYADRFVIFANIDWQGSGESDRPETWACHEPDFVRRTVLQLEAAARDGASGLKIFKRLGLSYRNPDGTLIRVDDPRWDPIWAACGRLNLPVLIHTADPAAFFEPVDARNERYEELSRHPDWSFYGGDFPSRQELLEARNRVIARHPQTIFIGAHVGNHPEDLATVRQWLQSYPNLYVEIAARIAELGRQPYTARRFLTEHADRVLFGTDGPIAETRLRYYFRFLETYDEYFPYAENDVPPQGLWNITGVGLPDDVLRKIYYENAAKLIPGVAEKLQAFQRSQAARR